MAVIMRRMKVVILAGGHGTRLAEETELRPKPMVDIGGRPILWHIMKHYARHGFKEFIVALGYRGEDIKRFFLDQVTLSGDLTVRLAERASTAGTSRRTTGPCISSTPALQRTPAGVWAAWPIGSADGPFMLTYGDGVSNVDLGDSWPITRRPTGWPH